MKFKNSQETYELRKIEWKSPSSCFYFFQGEQDLGKFYSSQGVVIVCLLDYQKEFFYLLKNKKIEIE